MAKEISLSYTASLNLYAVVKTSVGSYINSTTPEAFNSANWGSYAVVLTEYASATGQYHGDFPAISAGAYRVEIYLRSGGSPALSDGPPIAEGSIQWDGSAEVTLNSRAATASLLSGAAIATAIWQDSTSGDFTAAGSIGKSLYTGGAIPGAANGLFIAGTNAATAVTTSFTSSFTGNLTGNVGGSVTGTVASVVGSVGSVTGNVGGDVTGKVLGGGASAFTSIGVQSDLQTIKTQAVTASAGVTFPASIASPTNITAGVISTVTNLTNAPTVGDFTSAMKSSLNASTPTSVGSVTGAVASVTNPVSLNLSQTGLSPRNLGSIADASLTVGDALVASICAAAGKQSISGTAYTVETPSTATVIRVFTLDSSTSPTSRT